MRRLLLVLLFALALAGTVASGVLRLPPGWDPWAPLDLRLAPTALTRWKLARMGWRPEGCFESFAASGVPVTRVPDGAGDGSCPLLDAVRLAGFGPALAPPGPAATCRLAAAWALFDAHALQPAARRHLGQPVVRVRHLGTYACRNVRGGTRLSEHANGNAIDVAGFVLADGREVAVLRDWNDPGERGAFLRAARDGACRFFGAVLGPDHDAAHRDHLHLDRGPWRTCR